MILRNATIKYKGYDPDKLAKFSHKRVCCSCDNCGRVRYIEYHQYRNLCRKCKMRLPEMRELQSKMHKGKYEGKNNPNYGKHHTKKIKQKMRNNHAHLFGNKNPNWKGGLPLRDHVLPERNCIKLNHRFKGSEGHHITSGVIIYLPKDLHNRKYGICHDLKNNVNMNKINEISLKYLLGDF